MTNSLCNTHKPEHGESLSRWIVVRDVLHALLVPVVELFDKAVTLAVTVTRATKAEDLEYAFSGQARSAFLWLQCFLSNEKEREWCYTRGCPACIVEHSLHSEFSIRMLYAACLLSDVHYPFTLEGPRLPSFRFFLESLERALATDSLYGRDFFERMQPKAVATRNGIEDLIHQCVELEGALSRPSSPSDSVSGATSAATSAQSSPVLGPLGAKPSSEGSDIKLKRGRGPTRQMNLHMEEEQWMNEMLKRCWDQMQPAEQNSSMPVPSESLDGVLKTEPPVTITQVHSAG